MSFTLFSLFALPLWGVFYYLFFVMRSHGLSRQALAAKCAGSCLALMEACFGMALSGKLDTLLPAFLLLCAVADGVLELRFLPGVLAFGGAHVCLILFLLGAGGAPVWVWALWLLLLGFTLLLFRRELPRQGRMIPALVGYAALLSLVLALAAGAVLSGRRSPLLLAGALCFYLSDLIVAKLSFSGLDHKWEKPCMLLYWLALYLISALPWFD